MTKHTPAKNLDRDNRLRVSGWLAGLASWFGLGAYVRERRASEGAAFTTAFVSLAAKMAKADGVAVLAECQAFERFLGIRPDDAPMVRRLWDLAKQDTAGFELYAERIANLLVDEPEVKVNVLECLYYVACADGILHEGEDAFLKLISSQFGFDDAEVRRIRALFIRDLESPYEVLGLSPGATRGAVKKRYYELVRRIHPDKIIASGAETARIKAANAKLAAINSAYEAIMTDLKRARA